MISKPLATAALAAATLALTAGTTQAALTDPGRLGAGEPGFIGILQNTFGGTFSRSGADYTSDVGVTAVRVADDGADSSIPAGTYLAELVASYSDNEQEFGILESGEFMMVAKANSFGMLDETAVTFSATEATTLVARDGGESGLHTSEPTLNPGGKDQLITFRIEEEDGDESLLLFWEDLSDVPGVSKGRTKADYNDLVVQLSSVDTAAAVIPLPASAMGGILLVGGAGALGLFRKLRK
ncbi:MAG: hypothetical protein AAF656_02505 [Planctomycetota bacterium]